jgi:hypothetical protein
MSMHNLKLYVVVPLADTVRSVQAEWYPEFAVNK